jgi:2,3-bisphosphoglycerate-independent phosphoglycerate mutase
MCQSVDVFAAHPVNAARRAAGKPPATNIWLWGLGRRPNLRPFHEVYGKQGAMITAVDLLRGLAALIGWRRIEVPGATGYLDTDYAAKGRYAIEALESTDVVCVHVEATDEASHEGRAEAKIEALEQIDRHIVGPLHEALRAHGDYRILVTPDHPTPLRTKTHSHGFVPFAAAGTGIVPDQATTYDEPAAERRRRLERRAGPAETGVNLRKDRPPAPLERRLATSGPPATVHTRWLTQQSLQRTKTLAWFSRSIRAD